MEWLKKFMQGRYGVDQLSIALLVSSILFSLLSLFIQSTLLAFLVLALILICYFRILSKNRTKRYQENIKFLKHWKPLEKKLMKVLERLKGMKTHKYYKCPNCHQQLRVPKGKGNIRITCPKCHTAFSKRT